MITEVVQDNLVDAGTSKTARAPYRDGTMEYLGVYPEPTIGVNDVTCWLKKPVPLSADNVVV